MGEKLSHQLIDDGWFCALGTTEHPGMDPEGAIVKKGDPRTWDHNNGVTVVYDEAGRPWISTRPDAPGQLHLATLGRRGAYVPHSNDGGQFVREILPTLM